MASRHSSPQQPVRHARRRFTREQVVERIAAWADRYGAPPRVIDWDPSRALRARQPWLAERFAADDWPTWRQVQRHFGTFAAAVTEAGLTPRRTPNRRRNGLSGRAAITAAIRAWAMRYGEPPTMADWDPGRAREIGQPWRAARYREGDWPSAKAVRAHFGSHNRAVHAAGLQPRQPGTRRTGDRRFARETSSSLALVIAAEEAVGGAAVLRRRVIQVAEAQRSQDPLALRASLIHLAASALRWADDLPAVSPAADVA